MPKKGEGHFPSQIHEKTALRNKLHRCKVLKNLKLKQLGWGGNAELNDVITLSSTFNCRHVPLETEAKEASVHLNCFLLVLVSVR